MQTNALPAYDMSDNPIGCCPRFSPEGWDGAEPHSVWFFYTTCPKCAKAYGKNYVVGVVEL